MRVESAQNAVHHFWHKQALIDAVFRDKRVHIQ